MPGGLKRATPPPRLCPGRRPDPGPHVVAEDRVRVARSRPTKTVKKKSRPKPCASPAAPREKPSLTQVSYESNERKQHARGTRCCPAVAGVRSQSLGSGQLRSATPVVAQAVEPPRSGGPRRGRSRPSASPSSGLGKLQELHEDRRVVERGALSPRARARPFRTSPHADRVVGPRALEACTVSPRDRVRRNLEERQRSCAPPRTKRKARQRA